MRQKYFFILSEFSSSWKKFGQNIFDFILGMEEIQIFQTKY